MSNLFLQKNVVAKRKSNEVILIEWDSPYIAYQPNLMLKRYTVFANGAMQFSSIDPKRPLESQSYWIEQYHELDEVKHILLNDGWHINWEVYQITLNALSNIVNPFSQAVTLEKI